MSVRVSPTEKVRREIDALFMEGIDLAGQLEQVARLGARLIMQTAVEVEVEEFLGRARYQRTADVVDARAGSRNGFCSTTIKTTAGPVTLQRPKLRGTTEKFASRSAATRRVPGDRRLRPRSTRLGLGFCGLNLLLRRRPGSSHASV